jgi:hypothetical protein
MHLVRQGKEADAENYYPYYYIHISRLILLLIVPAYAARPGDYCPLLLTPAMRMLTYAYAYADVCVCVC